MSFSDLWLQLPCLPKGYVIPIVYADCVKESGHICKLTCLIQIEKPELGFIGSANESDSILEKTAL